MAKATLPVNFKDDIMNSSMGGRRRFKMINNSDGTVSLEDATTYDQIGSNFGAAQINATNQAVNESADKNKVIQDIEAIRNVTEDGYIAGALALKHVDNSLGHLNDEWIEIGNTNNSTKLDISVDLSIYKKIALLSIGTGSFLGRILGIVCVPISIFRNHNLFVPTAGQYNYGVHVWYVDENTIQISSEKTDTYAYVYGIK